MVSMLAKLPPHASSLYFGDEIRRLFPHLTDGFYLDFWPISSPLLTIFNPEMLCQLTQKQPQPKHPDVKSFLQPIIGEWNLIALEGSTWKRWRNTFNSGFSINHVMSLMPVLVEEILIFKNVLRKHAEVQDIFLLSNATLKLTIDVIGRVTMDHRLRSQSQPNELVSAIRHQASWCSLGTEFNPVKRLNFIRPIVHWYNTRRMDRYIHRELDRRYSSLAAKSTEKQKSVLDLALSAYLAETPEKPARIDATFRDLATAQIKTFIFAGHDTTSTAIVYTYHLLFSHPSALARVRAEHEAAFGADLALVAARLLEKPETLSPLTYTLAVIKESLRMFPPTATLRQGGPGFVLTAANGASFPAEGFRIVGDHYATHHHPALWPRPDEFLPERWLVDAGDPLYPPLNAWRPFERGPRSCIGQELALTQIKAILALTIRDFDIWPRYPGFNAEKSGDNEAQTLRGERAYLTRRGIGQPADMYPCRVSSAEGRKDHPSIRDRFAA